jgi:hypothetical protein
VTLVIAAILILNSWMSSAMSDSIRCGRKVIMQGDSRSELLQRCGEPRYKDRGVEEVRLEKGRKKVSVERWHYKQSSRGLERIVMIYRGRIVAVETGGR